MLADGAPAGTVGHEELAAAGAHDVLRERERGTGRVDGGLLVHEVFDYFGRGEPDVICTAHFGVEDWAISVTGRWGSVRALKMYEGEEVNEGTWSTTDDRIGEITGKMGKCTWIARTAYAIR